MKLESNRDYFDPSPIVALSSGLGGSIAVVRCSGVGALDALKSLTGLSSVSDRKAYRVFLKDKSGTPIDDSIVVYFPEGKSFTGEECAEYFIHSSSFIVQRLIQTLVTECGFSYALPGEFSFRAVKNGKLSLLQADSIRDVISADNQVALTHSLEKVKGQKGLLVEQLDIDLEHLLILTESGIDFSDQDLEEVSLPSLKIRLKKIQSILRNLLDGYQKGKRIQDGVSVSILGIPNAGKSSLFNHLLNEERAIVTDIPGTTRDLLQEKMILRHPNSGETVSLVLRDTAGIRQTDDPIEKTGVERAINSAIQSDLIFWMIDGISPIEPQIKALKSVLDNYTEKVLVIFSKADLVSMGQRKQIKSEFNSYDGVWVSTKTNEGIKELERIGIERSRNWLERQPGEVFLTRIEQEKAVLDALDQADEALKVEELDVFASEVRRLNNTLSCISGKRVTDDILSGIFSKFCIGK